MKDEAEMSAPMRGSQPVAFLVEGHGRYASTAVFLLQEDADAYRTTGATISPLFRSPQPALTDEERRAIEAGIANCEDITYGGPNDEEAAAVLRRLLERLG